ncbi:MAG: hypothetical protein K8F56_18250 [Rhodocyclaceae bacterium]|nr:hypothetical protein [Rhodocyclaceae bacterium]
MNKLIRIGRGRASNKAALEVIEEAREYVLSRPDVESVVILVGSPGQCRPFATPIDRPLDFIGMLELMKHDLFREK